MFEMGLIGAYAIVKEASKESEVQYENTVNTSDVKTKSFWGSLFNR